MKPRVRLRLSEHSALWTDQLDPAAAGALEATGAVRVAPEGRGWRVISGSIVGVTQVRDVELRIDPKISVARLLFLLLYAADAEGWRDEDADLATASDLPELLARAFVSRANHALLRGPLRGYVRRDEALPVLRGRVRAGDQLAARAGLAVPLEVTFDDYTADILENQILAAAVARLRATPRLSTGAHHQLRRLRLAVDDVTPWPAHERPPAVQFHRLNAHYEPAIDLARLVLAATTLDTSSGIARGSGVLFDMNRVFESFLTAAFAEVVAPPVLVTGQYVTGLDVAGNVEIRPDVTWWREGDCVAVADAKYKDLRASSLPSGDLYQLLAYCTVLGLEEGHLVYGAGAGPTRSLEVRRAGTTIHVHHLDLSGEPSVLLAQVAALSRSMLSHRPAA